MLFTVIKAELLKLRRAPVWLAFFSVPLLAAVMGTFNYLQNAGILTKQWYSLWTQHTLFSSFFFMPSLLGIFCAYQWRLEHRENNWNALMTLPVPGVLLCAGKLTVALGLSLLTQLWTGVLFFLCGRFAGLSGPLPPELPLWLALGFCASGGVCSLQLLLSMRIRSFAVPVCLALGGGIVGLMAANGGVGLFFPYSLLSMGMNANGSGALTPEKLPLFLTMAALFTVAPLALAAADLKRLDVETC